MRETKATKVKIDDTGVGGGVTDRLNELRAEGKIKAHIVPIIVGTPLGEANGDDERFLNVRAKPNWLARDLFLDIDCADEDLLAEAVEIKYRQTSSGKLRIEEKVEMKKRLAGRSASTCSWS